MGIDYDQYCILGWKFDRNDIERQISPAEYQKQDRFDTKTGKVTHQENVLVKAREYVLEVAGVQDEYIYDLAEAVAEKFGLNYAVDSDSDSFCLGIKLGENPDFGYSRVDLLDGSVCLDDLASFITTLKELQPDIAPDQAIELHFMYHVG